ncbi:MAG: phage terminase large subunit family protein [Sinimarinibacterium sp.]
MGARDYGVASAGERLDKLRWTHFVPRQLDHIDVWADANRVLPKETSAEHGHFRTDRTPYARQILRDLSDDSPCEDVVLCCATQLVKSETGLNWLGWIIDQNPGPVMIVQATVENGKRYVHQRINPMIRNCPSLRSKVKEARSRDSANTTFMKQFPGGFLVITGANSGAGLASMPARFLHFDERDDYPDDVDGQGEPTKIARSRQDTFRRRKRLTSSAPKRAKGDSRIVKEFEAGTRFYYHVRCPHCTHQQRLIFERLKRVSDDAAAYACSSCSALIAEHHKEALLAGGEWVAEAPLAKVRSYHLNSLYSPLGWLSWSALLAEYEEAVQAVERGDDELLRTFVNLRQALAYEERNDKVDKDELSKRAEAYPLRRIPRGGLVLIAGVDTQDNRFEIVVYAYGEDEECWVVDYTVLFGDLAQPDVWTKLDGYLQTRFPHEDGQTLGIEAAVMDTQGHFTHEVYNFCRYRRRMFAIRGVSRPNLPIKGRSSMVDVNYRGKIIKSGARLWQVGVDRAKDLLHNRLRIAQPGPGFIHVSNELPEPFFGGMASEQRVRKKTAHGFRHVWEPKPETPRNEPWDCSVYALFGAQALDLHKYTPAMWQRLRDRVAPVQGNMFTPSIEPPSANAAEVTEQRVVQTPAPARRARTQSPGRAKRPPAAGW